MKFVHQVSKGSLYNQIYIPKEAEKVFEVGDIVEVKLLKKKVGLYYSKTLKKQSEFKEKLIQKIFSSLANFHGIQQIFVVGSFLTEKIDYKDIDILLITQKKIEKLEERVYNSLVDRLQLKFHIISFPETSFLSLQRTCPLTKSMLYYFISNKEFKISQEEKKEINKSHLQFLLMMPEDILKINTNSRAFYDNIRRIVAISNFLENKSLNPIEINKQTSVVIGEFLCSQLKANEQISKDELVFLRKIIKEQINKIKNEIKKEIKRKS